MKPVTMNIINLILSSLILMFLTLEFVDRMEYKSEIAQAAEETLQYILENFKHDAQR